jgi:hypothetical protein
MKFRLAVHDCVEGEQFVLAIVAIRGGVAWLFPAWCGPAQPDAYSVIVHNVVTCAPKTPSDS